MPVQNISAVLPDATITMIKGYLTQAESPIPVLVSLTDADRAGLQSLGPARFSFVNEALIGAKANPAAVPGFLSVTEWDKDFAYWKALDDLRVTIEKLLGKITDTQRAVGAEAFRQARKFYDALAVAVEDVPGLKDLYDQLGEIFARDGVTPPPPPPPTP